MAFHALIFQGKCDILSDSQSNKLCISILQYSTHPLVYCIDVSILKIHRADGGSSLNDTTEGVGDERIDAVPQGTFTTARRPHDQDFLSLTNGEVDMLKRGFRLTLVCKTEILENNLRCLHVPDCRTNCSYSPLGFFVPG